MQALARQRLDQARAISWCGFLPLALASLLPTRKWRDEAAYGGKGQHQDDGEIAVMVVGKGDGPHQLSPEWKRYRRYQGIEKPRVAVLPHIPAEERR